MRVGLMNGIGERALQPLCDGLQLPYRRERGCACVYPRTHNHPLLTNPSALAASGLTRGARGGASD